MIYRQVTIVDMVDPVVLVLMAVALGALCGTAVTAAIVGARSRSKRIASRLRPELPRAACALLDNIDVFAVILDASLAPVYANHTARQERYISGQELSEPVFLRRAREVMVSGVPETREPDPANPKNTVRTRLFRLADRFVVVLAWDLGKEQRVNAMRRDFIANVSHELKTPIAAVGLLAEAVSAAADDPVLVRDFSKTLLKEAQRLGALSRDIIHLSEAQSNLLPEEREEIELREFVRQEVQALEGYAQQKRVRLVLTEEINDGRETIIRGRRTSLTSALANVLSNAVQHSPPGSKVGVGVALAKGFFNITVKDEGEGIASEHLGRIFERFYRVDDSRGREGGGTGLGLSIAKHSIAAHGGHIDVWSQPGVGSTFVLSLPLYSTKAIKKSKGRAGRAERKLAKILAGKTGKAKS